MNNLFNKGREKILEFFYRHKLEQSYFSEILKETNLTPNTTLKHLDVLQELHLLTSTKKIANTFYALDRNNPVVYSVLSYFDFKRYNSLPFVRRSAIQSYIEKLNVMPLMIILFGSSANETFSKESDIDLLLVYNKKEVKQKSDSEDIEAIFGIHVQTFIIDLAYFEDQLLRNQDKVISHAIKTGYPLSGFEQYYKRILK